MEKIENIEVTRSYAKKVQEKQYEPVDYFASYKAIVKPGATPEEIKAISDGLAELAEEDVLSKIDPQKVISRRVSMAALRTANSQLEKRINELEYKLNNLRPF